LSKSQTPSLEDDVLLPNSPYSASKAAAELICRSYHITFGLPVIITRSSNNYGPFQNAEKFLPKIIINALQKREIPIYGDGTNIRDWIHVYDNCNAILSVLKKGKVGEIYNISDNNQMDNLTLIDFVTQRINVNEINTIFVKDRLGHDFRYAISSKKIKELGWSPTIPFSSGVLECINHYEELLNNSNST
jgi:dTDP-glucose 4,6-dehydratase